MARRFIVNGKFLRAPMTGVHRVAAELARGLARLAAAGDPAVAGMAFELWHPHDAREPAALGLPLRNLGPMTHIAWEQLTLPLRKGDATLVNLCNIGPALARNAVTMIHDTQVHQTPESYSRAFRLWYHAIQPVFARRHRRILTVSDFSAGEIAAVGLVPRDAITVIHNGVDHVLATPADPGVVDRLGLRPHGYVVALASVQAHKNIAVLLRAFARPELAGRTLVLVGGTGREAFAAAGLAVPPSVVLAGRVSDGELRGLYEAALCLAFPSTTEGFGLPPLEAMLVGCPAVIAPCGALPEVCGNAALAVPPEDDAGWARTIADLATGSDGRAALVAAGRRQAERFTWDRAARDLAATLRNL
jgi:glycosyltransferase involved in cell wall biosynthesis